METRSCSGCKVVGNIDLFGGAGWGNPNRKCSRCWPQVRRGRQEEERKLQEDQEQGRREEQQWELERDRWYASHSSFQVGWRQRKERGSRGQSQKDHCFSWDPDCMDWEAYQEACAQSLIRKDWMEGLTFQEIGMESERRWLEEETDSSEEEGAEESVEEEDEESVEEEDDLGGEEESPEDEVSEEAGEESLNSYYGDSAGEEEREEEEVSEETAEHLAELRRRLQRGCKEKFAEDNEDAEGVLRRRLQRMEVEEEADKEKDAQDAGSGEGSGGDELDGGTSSEEDLAEEEEESSPSEGAGSTGEAEAKEDGGPASSAEEEAGELEGRGHWEVERSGEGEQGSSEEQLQEEADAGGKDYYESWKASRDAAMGLQEQVQASGGVDSFFRWTQGARLQEECTEEAMQELWI